MKRVAIQAQDFDVAGELAALEAQLDCLVPLHGHDRIGEWKTLAARGEWDALVRRLLVEHYDPAYHRSSLRNFTRLEHAPALRLPAPEAFFQIRPPRPGVYSMPSIAPSRSL